ncbi:MAG TPA: nitroreductase family deazaflavin-dependent oxidoreductase [Thermoleophilaceae bacterium]|jgi:deazaflavin-dependent oxidoreductase (nitroreductase family)
MKQSTARRVAHFNKRFTNRVTGPLVPHLPGFGLVKHVGRKSGRTYETPVNAFKRGDGFVFALVYGAEAQWVRNVIAAGGCELVHRGHTYRLTNPDIVHDETRNMVPAFPRPILGLVGVADFLRLSVAP